MSICRKITVLCALLMSLYAHAVNTDTRSDSLDIIHSDLHIDVSNFNAKVLYGSADIYFKAKVNNVAYIKLDLLGLMVDSVKSGSNTLTFAYNDTLLSITLPSALSANQQQTVSIYYHGTPIQPPGDFGGFYWDNTYAFNIGVSFLSDPHNYGKVWFPCFDNFVERCTFHFAITTDSTRSAFCNGYADSSTVNPNGTRVWYWTMRDEIPSYLASMSVADYAAVRDSYTAMNGPLPILLVARPSDTTNLKGSFQHLKSALSIFEDRFGPYEFNRVGYCVVPFNAGAMEHATNISYMRAIVNGNTQYENYMAHELSHHWFGDLATCDNEGDMWLNEGWARYCESIFYEGMYGANRYKQEVRTNHESVIHFAHVIDSAYWSPAGMPSKLTYSNNSVYEKGADRVHTLRGYMGDSLFFGCIKSYLQHYKMQDVNSYKLRDYLASCSGLDNINDFFADWIFDGGFPDFSIEDKKITGTGGSYNVGVTIRQRSDHTSHLFNKVPLQIAYFDSSGNKTVMTASVSGSCTQYFATLPFSPAYIALDFDEKLSDAVTDQWVKMAGAGHAYNLGTAKMVVNLNQSTDSSLVRVEHHWVAPDASKNNIPGLHLSDYRYWNVDGIFANDFQASGTINYDGTTNLASGYLDNTFITNSEDGR
jgi:aminopeptidase N